MSSRDQRRQHDILCPRLSGARLIPDSGVSYSGTTETAARHLTPRAELENIR